MKHRYSGLLPKVHLWADLALLNVSFILAYFTRFESVSDFPDNRYVNLLLVGNLLWVLSTYLFKTYQFNRLSYSINRQTVNVIKASILHAGIVLALIYFIKQGDEYSRKQFLFTYSFFVLSAVAVRMLMMYGIQLYREAGYNFRTYAIVGNGELAGMIDDFYKDHKELDVLMDVFATFKSNSVRFVVNQSHPLARTLSQDTAQDFSMDADVEAGYTAWGFRQSGLSISFQINQVPFNLNLVGRHNMENAVAAATIAAQLGVNLSVSAKALRNYEGIYRRHQLVGKKDGVWLIDDYAHNPVKCAAAIAACQPIAPKVVAWFQPHGYGPTKFLRNDFVQEISAVLRDEDEIWMSEIFYAGGTTTKDISANDLILDLKAKGKQAFFCADRKELLAETRTHLTDNCVLLLMGARDPSLEQFAKDVWAEL